MKTITYIDINNITHEEQYDDNVVEINLSYKDIIEIKGLDSLVNLQILNLGGNEITEIKNIDTMVNLHNNMITEIKNIDTMVNLQELYLSDNNI